MRRSLVLLFLLLLTGQAFGQYNFAVDTLRIDKMLHIALPKTTTSPANSNLAVLTQISVMDDTTNASVISVGIDATHVYVNSENTGSGTTLPIRWDFDGVEKMSLSTAGLLTTSSGAVIGGSVDITGNLELQNGADRTVNVETSIATNGDNLDIHAGDPVTSNTGGDLRLYGGESSVTANDGNVVLGFDGTNQIGNVAIGVGSTSGRLGIKNMAVGDFSIIVEGADGSIGFFVGEDAGGDFSLSVEDDASAIKVFLNSNGDSYIIGGDFGVGTNTPDVELDVVGDVEVVGDFDLSSGDMSISGPTGRLDFNMDAAGSAAIRFYKTGALLRGQIYQADTGTEDMVISTYSVGSKLVLNPSTIGKGNIELGNSGDGDSTFVYNTLTVGSSIAATNAVVVGGLVSDTYNYAVDVQGNDDYEVAIPAITALTDGLEVRFKANTANTGGVTLEITSVGDLDAILKKHDQALITGDIEAGQVVVCVFDGTNWQMTSQLGQ